MWRGFAPIRYTTVWQRCDATLVVCRAVKSVKGLSYAVTRADLGFRIRLSVVAANAVGSVRARSTATEPIILSQPKPKGRRIVGTNRPNYIPGGGGDDQLFGRGGSDTVVGGAGNDRMDGGRGNDYLDGGKGEDRISAGRAATRCWRTTATPTGSAAATETTVSWPTPRTSSQRTAS